MLKFFRDWYHRYFSDPQAVLLAVLLAGSLAVVLWMGKMLAVVLAAVVIAYLLEGMVQSLERRHVPRLLAVGAVFILFMLVLIFLVLGLIPLVSRQVGDFLRELPRMINEAQQLLSALPEEYPNLVTQQQLAAVASEVRSAVYDLSRQFLSISLASIQALVTVLIYLILGPLLVFFFLKDKAALVHWVTTFLPRDHELLHRVWHEVDLQIGNYVRGKVYEIIIVGTVTYVVFAWLGLNYAPLLGVLVGLSVLVPYIGATVVTLPVALAAYLQMGLGGEFAWVLLAYAVIQALDGNLLVPLLFSEAVNLHPVAIILAVLVFGGLWGFWGVFFAIPLATLVKALLHAWPRTPDPGEDLSVTPGE